MEDEDFTFSDEPKEAPDKKTTTKVAAPLEKKPNTNAMWIAGAIAIIFLCVLALFVAGKPAANAISSALSAEEPTAVTSQSDIAPPTATTQATIEAPNPATTENQPEFSGVGTTQAGSVAKTVVHWIDAGAGHVGVTFVFGPTQFEGEEIASYDGYAPSAVDNQRDFGSCGNDNGCKTVSVFIQLDENIFDVTDVEFTSEPTVARTYAGHGLIDALGVTYSGEIAFVLYVFDDVNKAVTDEIGDVGSYLGYEPQTVENQTVAGACGLPTGCVRTDVFILLNGEVIQSE